MIAMTRDREQTESAYRRLRTWIDEWTLEPGAVLGEVDLAARLSVSRTPLREALARLRREGLVEQAPGRSAVVAPVSIETAVHLYQAREALESYALALAARGPTGHLFASIAEELDLALAASAGPERAYELTTSFDAALGKACQNPILATMLEELNVRLARLRRLSHDKPDRIRRALEQRVTIARAVVAGNGDLAATLNSARLREGLEVVVDALTNTLLGPVVDQPLP